MRPAQKAKSETRLMQVTIHKVPDAVHQELEARARSQGLSLQKYMLNLLNQTAAEPSIHTVRAGSPAVRSHSDAIH